MNTIVFEEEVAITHAAEMRRERPLDLDRATTEWVGPRVVRCPITGYSVVAARPGVRKITSEEIYEWLRENFP
jgi:hypothetical protein